MGNGGGIGRDRRTFLEVTIRRCRAIVHPYDRSGGIFIPLMVVVVKGKVVGWCT